jgi:hypothetical protein
MTIITPNRRHRFSVLAAALGAAVALGCLASIGLYTDTVRLRHEISVAERRIGTLQVLNAELAAERYRLLDAGEGEARAASLGLILDASPRYVEASRLLGNL